MAIPYFKKETIEYSARLEKALGESCTFPLSSGKIPHKEFGKDRLLCGLADDLYHKVETLSHAQRWAIQYSNDPMAITTKRFCCIDIDCHDDKDATPYFYYLIEHKPEIFDGMYIEKSVKGGFHIVGFQNKYMKAKHRQYDYLVRINGKLLGIEIKIGRHYFLSYPSKGYTPLNKTLVEMLEAGELKEMSNHWNVDCGEIKRSAKMASLKPKMYDTSGFGDIKANSPEGYAEFLAEQWVLSYAKNEFGGRHYGAGMLAHQLYISGYSIELITESVKKYWSMMDREPRKGEIEEAIEEAPELVEFVKHENDWIMAKYISNKNKIVVH